MNGNLVASSEVVSHARFVHQVQNNVEWMHCRMHSKMFTVLTAFYSHSEIGFRENNVLFKPLSQPYH